MEKKMVDKFGKNYKMGTFTKVVYKSDLPLCSAAKKSGHIVSALVSKAIRFVEYTNIEEIVEGHASGEIGTRPAWEERVNDFVVRHKTKGTEYLRFTNIKNPATHRAYTIDGKPATYEEVKECGYVLPSHWKDNKEVPVVQCIKLENVISLGGVC